MTKNRPGRPSPLNAHVDQFEEWLIQGISTKKMVELAKSKLGIQTNPTSVVSFIRREPRLQQAWESLKVRKAVGGLTDPPGFSRVDDDRAVITLPYNSDRSAPSQAQIDEILAVRGLDPEEWEVKQILDNQWEANAGKGTKITLYQFKVWLFRKVTLAMLLPATPAFTTFYTPKVPNPSKPIVTVIETDPQHPFIIPELDQLAVNFIDYLKPDRHVVGGDLMNLGYIGRHRDNPKWDDSVNAAKQSAFEYLYQRRNVAPDMEMWLIPGNHDDRIRNEQLERNERLYGITQAHYPGQPEGPRVYSLSHLLLLEDIGVNYREPEGTYEFEYVELTPVLAVRHGHLISKGGPLKTANDLGHSVVLGHTHSQSAAAQTIWNKIANTWQVRWAIEAGCECQIEEGLGFNKAGAPDWQPGFVTVTSFPNGSFTFDFAQYSQDGVLRWRDKEFSL